MCLALCPSSPVSFVAEPDPVSDSSLAQVEAISLSNSQGVAIESYKVAKWSTDGTPGYFYPTSATPPANEWTRLNFTVFSPASYAPNGSFVVLDFSISSTRVSPLSSGTYIFSADDAPAPPSVTMQSGLVASSDSVYGTLNKGLSTLTVSNTASSSILSFHLVLSFPVTSYSYKATKGFTVFFSYNPYQGFFVGTYSRPVYSLVCSISPYSYSSTDSTGIIVDNDNRLQQEAQAREDSAQASAQNDVESAIQGADNTLSGPLNMMAAVEQLGDEMVNAFKTSGEYTFHFPGVKGPFMPDGSMVTIIDEQDVDLSYLRERFGILLDALGLVALGLCGWKALDFIYHVLQEILMDREVEQ